MSGMHAPLETIYHFHFVALSVVVAICASYVALDLTTSPSKDGLVKQKWLAAGTFAMGFGIWSMHFIGMLAFEMPGHEMSYSTGLLILSIIIALAASAPTFYVVGRKKLTWTALILSSSAMATGIVGMHYTGMLSMRMDADVVWNTKWIAISVLIALVASFAALSVVKHLPTAKYPRTIKLIASILMGFAISGMHYSGMVAAEFYHSHDSVVPGSHVVANDGLAFAVIASTLLILAIAWGGSVFDRLIALRMRQAEARERKRSEHELRSREHQLREAQAIANVGSWDWDIEKDKIIWSDQLYKIFEVDRHNFDSSYQAYLDRLSPHLRDRILTAVRRAREAGEPYDIEYEFVRQDGGVRYLQTRGIAVKNSDGKINRLMGTCQDITDQKQTADALVRSHTELELRVQERTRQLLEALERERMAKEAKMNFLANMSHEIRTPMNAILGFSDLLLDDAVTQKQRELLSKIKTNGDHLLNLINDILDLSKFEAGSIPVEKTPQNLTRLITEAVSGVSALAQKKGIELKIVYETAIAETIQTDALRLRQVLTNLLSNAIKFTDRGAITVRISQKTKPFALRRSELTIDVEDTGVGIQMSDQEKLFQPFTQGDSSGARRFGGTGLGLALSRQLAIAMDGELKLLRSSAGEGSTFRLTLDMEEMKAAKIVPQGQQGVGVAVASVPKNKGGAADLKLTPCRLLLAEDSPDNEELVRMYLNFDGVEVDVVQNGHDAITKATAKEYDLVLMDVQMPGLDGLEATRRLRELGYSRPIIALTAHAMAEDRDRSLKAGCSGHLTKPILRAELITAIQSELT